MGRFLAKRFLPRLPKISWLLSFCFLLSCALILCGREPVEASSPQRVVSINLCSDILAALLAKPGTLKSVFRLTKDPGDSPVADLVNAIPQNDAQAEEVIALNPDLVLADRYTSPFTLDVLRRAGLRVVQVPEAKNLADTVANVRLVARALGREEEGEKVVQRFEERMAQSFRPMSADAPTALYYQNRGTAAVEGSQGGQLLKHAGLRNVLGVDAKAGFGNVPVEDVIRLSPDLLVLGMYREGQPSLATSVLQHPALQAYARQQEVEILPLPWASAACGTPFIADLAERLAHAHDMFDQEGVEGNTP